MRPVGVISSADNVFKEPIMVRSVADGSIFSKVREEIQFMDASGPKCISCILLLTEGLHCL